MTVSTQLECITTLEMFLDSIPNGQEAICVTKCAMYGIKIKKINNTLYDLHRSTPLALSKEILTYQFNLV